MNRAHSYVTAIPFSNTDTEATRCLNIPSGCLVVCINDRVNDPGLLTDPGSINKVVSLGVHRPAINVRGF